MRGVWEPKSSQRRPGGAWRKKQGLAVSRPNDSVHSQAMLLGARRGPRLQDGEKAGQRFCSAALQIASSLRTETLQAGSSANDPGAPGLSLVMGFGWVSAMAVNLAGPHRWMEGPHCSSSPPLTSWSPPCSYPYTETPACPLTRGAQGYQGDSK